MPSKRQQRSTGSSPNGVAIEESRVPTSTAWKTLVDLHTDDSRLKTPVIYSLPSRLIECIRVHAPKVLTDQDLQFEGDLRRLGGSGFQDQVPFLSGILECDNSEIRVPFSTDPRKDILTAVDLLDHDVFAPDSTQDRQASRETIRVRALDRLRGFAGWLVTNPDFRRELAELKTTWQTWSRFLLPLPSLETMSQLRLHTNNGETLSALSRAQREATNFLHRWNLQGMTTWELPRPVEPVHIAADELPRNELRSQGVSVFIPFSMFVDADLRLTDIADYHRQRHDLSHLIGWLDKVDSWGPDRNSDLFRIWVYLELALKSRYEHRLQRNLGRIDMAFRDYFGPRVADEDTLRASADSIRKVRDELKRRLTHGVPT